MRPRKGNTGGAKGGATAKRSSSEWVLSEAEAFGGTRMVELMGDMIRRDARLASSELTRVWYPYAVEKLDAARTLAIAGCCGSAAFASPNAAAASDALMGMRSAAGSSSEVEPITPAVAARLLNFHFHESMDALQVATSLLDIAGMTTADQGLGSIEGNVWGSGSLIPTEAADVDQSRDKVSRRRESDNQLRPDDLPADRARPRVAPASPAAAAAAPRRRGGRGQLPAAADSDSEPEIISSP